MRSDAILRHLGAKSVGLPGDIKPQNLLVDGKTHVLKFCDFGSAKRLIAGEPNVACARGAEMAAIVFVV